MFMRKITSMHSILEMLKFYLKSFQSKLDLGGATISEDKRSVVFLPGIWDFTATKFSLCKMQCYEALSRSALQFAICLSIIVD